MRSIVIEWDMNVMYPLVMTNIAFENSDRNSSFFSSKMVIFHSYRTVYQRATDRLSQRKKSIQHFHSERVFQLAMFE